MKISTMTLPLKVYDIGASQHKSVQFIINLIYFSEFAISQETVYALIN